MALRWVTSLQDPGQCHHCGTSQRKGLPAWWDDETREIRCVGCRPAPDSEPEPPPREEAPAPPEDSLQQRWSQLVRYLRRCVQAESALPVTLLNSSRWAVLPLGRETAFCEGAERVALHPDLDRLAGRVLSGQALYYGWPTVVLRMLDELCVAPLFVAELAPPPYGPSGILLREEPALNPALVSSSWFDASAVAAVRAEVGEALPIGDPAAMARVATRVATALGLEGGPLEPSRLRPDVPRGTGLHNGALVLRAESAQATRLLLEELEELETRDDWQGTGAAVLLGLPAPDREARRGALAAPLPVNPGQAEALQALRHRALTVVEAPPGTGRTQVAVAAVGGAWLDGESVLVASTNPEAVEAAVGRAGEIHPGLLLRTGNREDREALPAAVAGLVEVVRAEEIPGDEASARRSVELAVEARLEISREAEVQDALLASLASATLGEEEAARRAWPGAVPPAAADPEVEGRQAERLAGAWLLGGWRQKWYLRRLGALPEATVQDVARWARAAGAFARTFEELRARRVVDRAVLEAADAGWVSASAAAVAACASATLHGRVDQVEAVARCRPAGLRQAIARARAGARGWACTSLAVGASFELVAGLFDLVILDQGNECSLAAALPLAYRGRRVAVLGDPLQAHPPTVLDPCRLRELVEDSGFQQGPLEAAGLAHGCGSAFTAFSRVATPAPLPLVEHFRCHPAIARWFHQGVVVRTDVAALGEGRRGIRWIDVAGRAEPGPRGSLFHGAEAEAVLEALEEELSQGATVGVLTPFAAQAGLIQDAAERAFPEDWLARARFSAGTPLAPQGDGWDVVLFSAVVGPGTSPRTLRWLEQERPMFHVAASCARRALVVFGNPESGVPTLVSLREEALAGPRRADAAPSEAERRLFDSLFQVGLEPLHRALVEGYEVGLRMRDLVLEVDPGLPRPGDFARDRVLQRLGFRVLRVPAWRALREPHRVAMEVALQLEEAPPVPVPALA